MAETASQNQSSLKNKDKITKFNIKVRESLNKLPKSFFHIGLLLIADGIIFLILLLILTQLPKKADEVKQLRNRIYGSSSGADSETITRVLAEHKEKISILESYVPDETGVVNFIRTLDLLKKEGVIFSFSFASEQPIKDRLGYSALPILIEIKGDDVVINQAYDRILSLPYLIRTVTMELRTISNTEGSLARFGGVLYVSKSFTEN